MDAAFKAFKDMDEWQREYSESGRPDLTTSFSSSTSEEFGQRPPSRAGWHDSCEEVQFDDRYEAHIVDEFENSNNDDVHSGYLRSQDYSQSMKRCQWVSGSPRFKGKRARYLEPSTYHARKRRHQIVATGWAEVFSTISEELLREEAVQEAGCSSSRPSTADTSTAAQTSRSATEVSETTCKLKATPAVAMSTSTTNLNFQVPDPASQRNLLIETTSSMAMLEKWSDDSGLQATSFATLQFSPKSNLPDDVPKAEGSVNTTETSDGPLLLCTFTPALCSGLEKSSIINFDATSSDGSLTERRSNAMAEGVSGLLEEDDEEPIHAVALVLNSTLNVEPHLQHAANEKPLKLDQMGRPDRNCVFLLTVSLLVAVFFVASVFYARTSFRFGAPPEHPLTKVANNKVDIDANATNLDGRQLSVPVVDRAAALDRSLVSSTLSAASLEKSTSFIAKKGQARTTKMADGIGVSRGSLPLTKLEKLPSVVRSTFLSATNDYTVTDKTTPIELFVNQSAFTDYKETFAYDKNDTNVDDDVF
ncbi:hypothetical protein HPB51_022463 [Rhipicephalus microplus]|uniref:Transmembrane protein n=1 Tax=Rhipicephalus microplus TaxID=6941 RepID=A0A9J6DR85_RHIMP|nr:hypothetical protein HPB51_022463 [Rhipicephalus microplus]